jgi:hypothetical protein
VCTQGCHNIWKEEEDRRGEGASLSTHPTACNLEAPSLTQAHPCLLVLVVVTGALPAVPPVQSAGMVEPSTPYTGRAAGGAATAAAASAFTPLQPLCFHMS